jgi:hypothetical protein
LEDENYDLRQLLDYHRDKINFFSHERLIHLLVMILFAVCTVITILAIVIWQTLSLIPLAILLLVLLVPYIKHYYFLENSVQQLYKYYDVMYKKVYGINQEDK